MITITPDNKIERDSEVIGSIIGTTAWMKAKPAGRIAGQIRQAAGIDGLKFEVADTPEDQANLSPPISSAAVIDGDSVMEPVPVSDDAGAGISFAIGSGWGTPGTAYFARCFINHYGPDGYSRFCNNRGI